MINIQSVWGKGTIEHFLSQVKFIIHKIILRIVICSFALDLQECNDALFSLSMMDLLWHQLYHLAKTGELRGVNAQIH